MDRYLILGSSGFIGKHLCKYLKSFNYEVIEYDIENSENEDLRKIDDLKLKSYVVKSDFVFF